MAKEFEDVLLPDLAIVQATVISPDATLLEISKALSKSAAQHYSLTPYLTGYGSALIPPLHPEKSHVYTVRYPWLEAAGLANVYKVVYTNLATTPAIVERLGYASVYSGAVITGNWKPFYAAISASHKIFGWRIWGQHFKDDFAMAFILSETVLRNILKETKRWRGIR